MDLDSKQVQVLTDSNKDESPTFAPNGRMILIATEIGGRGVLSLPFRPTGGSSNVFPSPPVMSANRHGAHSPDNPAILNSDAGEIP